MRLRYNANALPYLKEQKQYFVQNPEKNKGKWNKIFNNDNPIHVEIGMGKGDFILKKALLNNNINYIGIEKFDTVLAKAVKKFNKCELLKNLKIISFDAMELLNIFENGEISKLYLNFSDPWPKARHEKRRLTHMSFMNSYKKILNNDSIIQFKTDNDKLFEYTINDILRKNNKIFKIIYLTNDLYSELDKPINKNNTATEYENKFHLQNKNINKVVFKFI